MEKTFKFPFGHVMFEIAIKPWRGAIRLAVGNTHMSEGVLSQICKCGSF